MSDTPRTNRIRKMLRMSREVVRPREDQLALLEGAENGIEELERELAAVTAERDRMRPVVEAAQSHRKINDIDSGNDLISAVLKYEATK